MIAIALRQPLLAEALGLIVPLNVPIAPAGLLANGGDHVTPSPASGISFAAEPDRQDLCFALSVSPGCAAHSVHPSSLPESPTFRRRFPTTSSFQEAVSYDDGFAKIVHGAQPTQYEPLKEEEDGSRPHHGLVGIR